MKRKILAFLMTVLMVLGSTAAIFATAAYADDAIPSNIVFSIDEVVLDEGDTEATLAIWMTGVADEDDVGSIDLRVGYDTSKIRITSYYDTTGSGKKKVYYGASAFNTQASPVAGDPVNPFVILCWTTEEENLYLDTDYEINDMEFCFLDVEILDGWSGTMPLTLTATALRRSDNAPIAVSTVNGFIKNGDEPEPIVNDTLNVTVEGTGSVDVAFATVNETVTDAAGFAPEAGVAVTLTAGEGFAFWQNTANGKVLSTDNVFTYTATGASVALTAVFEATDPGVATIPVYFKDGLTGKLLGTIDVAEGTELAASDIPAEPVTMVGYTFDKWIVTKEGQKVEDAIGYVITEPTTVHSRYLKDNTTTYTLTVDNGENVRTYQRSFAALGTVTSYLDDFAYWKMDDTIVSTDKSYKFAMPNHDVTLTAVGGAVTAPEAVVALVDCVLDGDVLVITESRSVADGCTLVESGVLLTRKAAATDLVYPKLLSTVTQTASSDKTATVVGFQKTGMSTKTGTWMIRGYMVYRTVAGDLVTVYSDVASVVVA